MLAGRPCCWPAGCEHRPRLQARNRAAGWLHRHSGAEHHAKQVQRLIRSLVFRFLRDSVRIIRAD
jgi:hypothetical protein